MAHPYKQRAPMSLKAATARAYEDLGGIKCAAAIPGVSRSANHLHRYGDEADDNIRRNIPMDIAAVLTRAAVSRGLTPHLLHWLQSQAEEVGTPVATPMHTLTSLMGKEFGEVCGTLAAVLDPASAAGVDMDANERRAVLRELLDLQNIVRRAIDKVQGLPT